MDDDTRGPRQGDSWVPRPDPTVLTTEALLREIGTAKAQFRENIDTQKELFATQLNLSMKMLDERYATQTKALDAAFLAQQAAMTTAFSAAEKAVQAALLAAEKAVDKANTASEKRFEAVNEFRAQLADIISTMMPRTEVATLVGSLEDKILDMKSTVDKGFSANAGAERGSRENMAAVYAAITIAATLLIGISAVLAVFLHH